MTELHDKGRIVSQGKERATMQAVVQHEYGSPAMLDVAEISKPAPKANEVLISVRAAGINFADPKVMRGEPYVFRLMYGIRSPRNEVPLFDLAGVVDAVGEDVTTLRPGEAVYGACTGALAEYACGRANRFVPKPVNLTFAEAAAVPQTGCVALQALRDVAHVEAGQSVLINGASGGVGTYAVQVAKAFGAEVTGVCSPASADMVRSIGADRVIDYTRDDFTQGDERYDVILDNVENHSQAACRRVLNPGGVLIPNNGESLARVLKGFVLAPFVRPKLRRFLSLTKPDDLRDLTRLIESGKVTPIVDRSFPLEASADAFAHMETGHVHGKVVVTI